MYLVECPKDENGVFVPKPLPKNFKEHYFSMGVWDKVYLERSKEADDDDVDMSDYPTSSKYSMSYDVAVSYSDYRVFDVDSSRPELGKYAVCCVTETYTVTEFFMWRYIDDFFINYGRFLYGLPYFDRVGYSTNLYVYTLDSLLPKYDLPTSLFDYFGIKNIGGRYKYQYTYYMPFFQTRTLNFEKIEYVNVVDNLTIQKRFWERKGWEYDSFSCGYGALFSIPSNCVAFKSEVNSYFYKDNFVGELGRYRNSFPETSPKFY